MQKEPFNLLHLRRKALGKKSENLGKPSEISGTLSAHSWCNLPIFQSPRYVLSDGADMPLIKESEHPKREFSTIGNIPIVGENIRVFNTCNLREVLAAATYFKGVF